MASVESDLGRVALGSEAAAPRQSARGAVLKSSLALLALSRLAVWIAGVGAVQANGVARHEGAFDGAGTVAGLGSLARLFAAPVARWDALWYFAIAGHGYVFGAPSTPRMAFFPLYPLLVAALAGPGLPIVLAGAVVSLAALLGALCAVQVLVRIEFGASRRAQHAGLLAAALVAFSPMGVFWSAGYAESLLLMLSIATFVFARRGSWLAACACAALAGATRAPGLLLALPVAWLYLYGPRADVQPDRPPGGLRPRYRLRRDALFGLLIPVPFVAYLGYLAAHGASFTAPFRAESQHWGRTFAPFSALVNGVAPGWHGTLESLGVTAKMNPLAFANAYELWLTVLFLLAAVGVTRLLPFAYALFTWAGTFLVLSTSIATEPLTSTPRYLAVLFPVYVWAGWRLAPRLRVAWGVVVACGASMVFFAAAFAMWEWVA